MPPKRKSKANALSNTQPTASDYDTDTANFTDTNLAALPAPPVRTNQELNMLVLRRWCPDLQSILAIAPFAVLYIFSPDTQAWEKCETQGSLFLCQLQSYDSTPRYRVIILNRKNPENWTFDVETSDSIEVTEEYVIVQKTDEDGGEQIYGIWIFSDGESKTRELIGATIMQCAEAAEQFAPAGNEEEIYEQNGYHHQEQSYEEPIQRAHTPNQQAQIPFQQPQGQSIDIATLFAKPAQQYTPQAQQSVPSQQNALLDLFRTAKQG